MDGESESTDAHSRSGTDRRDFVATASSLAMCTGLAAAYGTFGALSARYLFPAKPREQTWLFVAVASAIEPGGSLVFRSPAGEKIAIARQSSTGSAADFIALSSTCPHLGCQVHWEGAKSRFFCPCHNGTFDPSGRATGGPPGEAGLSLPRYALKIESGLLYIQVPTEKLSGGETKTARASRGELGPASRGDERTDVGIVRPAALDGPPGPGHDPCLFPDRRGEVS